MLVIGKLIEKTICSSLFVIFHVVVGHADVFKICGIFRVLLAVPVTPEVGLPHFISIGIRGKSSSASFSVSVRRDWSLAEVLAVKGARVASVGTVRDVVVGGVVKHIRKSVVVAVVAVGRWGRWNVWRVVFSSVGVISYWCHWCGRCRDFHGCCLKLSCCRLGCGCGCCCRR